MGHRSAKIRKINMHQPTTSGLPTPLNDIDAIIEAVHKVGKIRPETFAMPEVAKYMGLHPQTARDWVRRGILPPPMIKVGRTVRWTRTQLEKVLADGVRA